MKTVTGFLGKHNKALIVLGAFGVALAGKQAGVDVGLDVDDTWKAVLASLLVYLVPNKAAE